MTLLGALLRSHSTEAQTAKTRLILLGTGGGPRPRKASSASAQVIIRNDAAYVKGPRGRYVVAILARHVKDKSPGVDNKALVTGARISRMVYDAFAAPLASPKR